MELLCLAIRSLSQPNQILPLFNSILESDSLVGVLIHINKRTEVL